MPAIPIIAAAAAVGGTVIAAKGLSAAKDAQNAQQNFANEAAGAGAAAAAAADDRALAAYYTSNPAFSSEYNRLAAAGGTGGRSATQWLKDHLAENPDAANEFQQFKSTSGIIPSSIAGPGGTIDLNAAQTAAQIIAQQNAANSAALEAQYNPGAAELRAGSLQSLLAELNAQRTERDALAAQVAAQAGKPLTVGAAQQYDSALTRQAVEAASRDLALGGELPQDVRNLVARNAFARSGSVSGGLGLGRDISARDLGLTSLDLQRARLAAAAQLGGQEAALNAGNANLRYQNDAQRLAAEQFGRTNLLDSASFMEQVANGDFGRSLAAAQLGQNIAQPLSGLDPGSFVNLAVGNSNQAANAQQQAMAGAGGLGQQQAQFGAQLVGTGLGLAQQFYKPTPAAPKVQPYIPYNPSTYTPPVRNAGSIGPSIFG